MKKALKNLLLAAAAIFISASLVSCNTDTETETEYVNVYSYTDTIYGTISSKNYYTEYRFYGNSGTTYNVSVSSDYTVYMQAGSSSSGSDYFSETYSSSKSFTPSSSGYVYIKVKPYSSYYTGSFTLTVSSDYYSISLEEYSSNDITASGSVSIHSYSSTDVANDYKIVYLTSSSDTYYSLSTTSGTTYTVQWCDSDTKSNFSNTSSYSFIDGKITAYDSSLLQLNYTDTSSSFTFTATGSTTYIGVKKYSSSTSNGYCAFYVYY